MAGYSEACSVPVLCLLSRSWEMRLKQRVFSEWDLVRSSEISCLCGLRKEPVFSMVMASVLTFHPSVGLRIKCTSKPHAK